LTVGRRTKLYRWPRSILWSVAGLATFGSANPARPQGASLEYAVKATYLDKFAPFVEWPSPAAEFPAGAFTVCVVGNDPLGSLLDRAVTGQDVAGHPIVVRRMASVGSNPGCSVMYATGSPAQSVADALAAVRGLPVLTVTDGATDPAAKGIINFVIADDRVRFEINKGVAAADSLTISSKLLSLAVRVDGAGR
jgi:hypothetical protein